MDNLSTGSAVQQHDPKAPTARFSESFTLRAVIVGLGLGIVVCLSNTYFGLQTGFASQMTMSSSLLGFAIFKGLKNQLRKPLTPAETCLIQTIASAVGCIPSTASLIGLIPALEFLLGPKDKGPIKMTYFQLLAWSLGISFFGLVWAMLLREQFVVREKLPFPGAKATAYLIKALHKSDHVTISSRQSTHYVPISDSDDNEAAQELAQNVARGHIKHDWDSNIQALFYAGALSGIITLTMYFWPILRALPLFGHNLASNWMWTISLSPGFIGQGIITGPAIPLHMLVGVIVGWGILSPIAKHRGWAPGHVDDWEHGSRGWIIWISLAALLTDCIVQLGWLLLRPYTKGHDIGFSSYSTIWSRVRPNFSTSRNTTSGYDPLLPEPDEQPTFSAGETRPFQAPPEAVRHGSPLGRDNSQLPGPHHKLSSLPTRTLVGLLVCAVCMCVTTTRYVFGALIPISSIFFAVALSLPFSIIGIRALGETDYNPMAGISKISQIIFALVIPRSNPNRVLINLIAGGISEAGAGQAGDIAFDLKVGELVGASPEAQLYGQIVGSAAGTFVACGLYMLYTSAYAIPGPLFQVPLSYIWILSARLVAGGSVPPMAAEFAIGFSVLIAVGTIVRIAFAGSWWINCVPGGVAFAIGIYNVPSFTIGRAFGGMIFWYYCIHKRQDQDFFLALASGLVLGEGLVSILSLVLTVIHAP